MFAAEESNLTRQIEAIEGESVASLKEVNQRSILAEQFEQVGINGHPCGRTVPVVTCRRTGQHVLGRDIGGSNAVISSR